eukprot:1289705-Pyramimonas_sp.AAC.1
MRSVPRGPSVELPMGPRSATLGGGTHVDSAIEAYGGAPYGATKRCTAWGRRMRAVALEPS